METILGYFHAGGSFAGAVVAGITLWRVVVLENLQVAQGAKIDQYIEDVGKIKGFLNLD